MVQISSPSVPDFNPDPAIQLWLRTDSKCPRRPDFMETTAAGSDTDSDDETHGMAQHERQHFAELWAANLKAAIIAAQHST